MIKIKNPDGIELRFDTRHGVYWLAVRTSKDVTHLIRLAELCGNISHWEDIKAWADKQFKIDDWHDRLAEKGKKHKGGTP